MLFVFFFPARQREIFWEVYFSKADHTETGNSRSVLVGSPQAHPGGIPSEWGALTNLKELKMENCGLGGKPPSTRSERSYFLFLRWKVCCVA